MPPSLTLRSSIIGSHAVTTKASSSSVPSRHIPPLETVCRPPPLDYKRSPYCCVPLPAQRAVAIEVAIHPMLRADSVSTIEFDMASPPQPMIDLSGQPATSPPLPSLTIVSPCLPWAIVVHGTSCFGPAPFVSVSDVLSTLYNALRALVTPEEFLSATAAPATRNRSSPQMIDIESRGPRCYWAGMQRLHFLRGKQTFGGLSRSASGAETWVLSSQ
ncbi:hypothetical protein HGRIS_011875 [Hohenbuehelia grisea]|uniref:DUF6699 domain-containing protein n=1 Tax=Hohenbuehelia grisea TaxID=104357 RepID=A0ABR3JWE4_9AGAR